MRMINIKPNSIFLEPFGRNTAPAIALAALKSLELANNPNLLILSSDHEIKDSKKFLEVVNKGIKYSSKGQLVTFGIVPKSPETGYGYIKSTDSLDNNNAEGLPIESFIEKPDKLTAEKFIKDKNIHGTVGFFYLKLNLFLKK